MAAHQQITMEWWLKAAVRFDVCVSPVVMAEVGRGDADAARVRLDMISEFKILEVGPDIRELAELRLPEKAHADCYHLAVACWHGVDYLVSWNLAHIVNGEVIRRIRDLNDARGVGTSIICTPEELMEELWNETP